MSQRKIISPSHWRRRWQRWGIGVCRLSLIVLAMAALAFSQKTDEDDKAVKDFFKPEFRNRLDGIIKFNKLSDLSMRKIVGKFIGELNELLAEKQLRVRLTEKAVDELMTKGFDSKMGARPLQRQINDLVKVPLSKKILFENIATNSTVIVDFTNSAFVFKTVSSTDTTYRIDENGYIVLEEPV